MYYSITKNAKGDFFDDFPKISTHFPKILEKLFEGQTIVSRHFPKISEEEPMMFRAYSNKGLCNHGNGDLFSTHGDANILTRKR